MNFLARSTRFRALGDPFGFFLNAAGQQMGLARCFFSDERSSRKRKASTVLENKAGKKQRCEPVKLIHLLPDEILLRIFHAVGDHGLVALIEADRHFMGCAVEAFRSSLEKRGIISDFLGSLKLELGPNTSAVDLYFLSTFFPLSEINRKVILDCDFWILLSFNQSIRRIVQRSHSLATVRVRLYSQELDLLQVSHAAPALRSLWNVIGMKGALDSIELLCDGRKPPPRELVLHEAVPPLHSSVPILRARNITINTAFYYISCRQRANILHPLLHNPFPSMLWIHIHPHHPSFRWKDVHLESLRSLWLISDHHVLIDPSFYRRHPSLASISTTRPYIQHEPVTRRKCSKVANKVPPLLEYLTTSPDFLWESKGSLALRCLHINAREPWSILAPISEPESPAFCSKVNEMVRVLQRIPTHRIHQMKVEFEFPAGLSQHCSALDDFLCSCTLNGKGTMPLESLALQVDELSVPVYNYILRLLGAFPRIRELQISTYTCRTEIVEEEEFAAKLKAKFPRLTVLEAYHGTWSADGLALRFQPNC